MTSEIKHPADFYKEKVFSLTNLPTLPVIATEILRVTREDKMSINQMLPIIEKDPPLAMKVLKIANSAYYGMRSKVKSLGHAVVVIGLQQLSNISISFSVLQNLYDDASSRHISWKKYWHHCIATGYVTQLLYDELGIFSKDNPYTFGLLHDIGKLVSFKIDPEKFSKALALAKLENCSHNEAEMKVIGVSHSSIGQWITEKWGMAEFLINVVAYHHYPEDIEDPKIRTACSIVQVSDIICNNINLDFGIKNDLSDGENCAGWKYLKETQRSLADLDFEEFMEDLQNELDTIQEMVNLIQI